MAERDERPVLILFAGLSSSSLLSLGLKVLSGRVILTMCFLLLSWVWVVENLEGGGRLVAERCDLLSCDESLVWEILSALKFVAVSLAVMDSPSLSLLYSDRPSIQVCVFPSSLEP